MLEIALLETDIILSEIYCPRQTDHSRWNRRKILKAGQKTIIEIGHNVVNEDISTTFNSF